MIFVIPVSVMRPDSELYDNTVASNLLLIFDESTTTTLFPPMYAKYVETLRDRFWLDEGEIMIAVVELVLYLSPGLPC